MPRNIEYVKFPWRDYDGQKVLIDGRHYKLKVSTYQAIYPYKHQAISVNADPVYKKSEWYLEVKGKLGDDWSLDVLSCPETEGQVMKNLEEERT
jgi:hypothetical protein